MPDLIYLAIGKKYEPLLLLPIAFGMLLANLPGAELFHMEYFLREELNYSEILHGGLLDILYLGVKLGIYPSLIFLGVGAMTDFTPLIANPKSLLLGAAAQFGVFAAFFGALFLGFDPEQAAAIGIIGGASRTDCNRCLFLYGADSDHTAAVHETLNNEKRTFGGHEKSAPGFQG